MTHEIRAFTTAQFDLNTAGKVLAIEEWHEPVVMEDTIQRPTIREDIDGNKYLYAEYSLDDTYDISNILRKFGEGLGYYLPWAVIETRRTAREYRENKYKNDKTYARPSLDTGLRSDPSFTVEDYQTLRVGPVEYRINGTDYSFDGKTVKLDGHQTMRRTDTLAVNKNEELVIEKGQVGNPPSEPPPPQNTVTLGTVEMYPSEIISFDEKTQHEQYSDSDWTTEYEFGTIPEYIPR